MPSHKKDWNEEVMCVCGIETKTKFITYTSHVYMEFKACDFFLIDDQVIL